MANISRNTFDKLKHYVNVRMQQGVPLVDADWNEKDDIRKNEMQLFLKWFIGNGIPKGNDGFHILPQAGDNDFLIKGGANGQPGICLVEGWDARNETDIAYQEQPLFNNNTLAQEWGVTTLPALTLPASGQRTDLVYLDAWEREVNAVEDPGLVNPAINIETCVRLKREWVVRVAEGTSTIPAAVPVGHVFYPLAAIVRRAGQPVIAQADITDLRTTGLSILGEPITIKNNNVGIGVPEPLAKLEVNGSIILSTNQELFITENGQVRSGDNNHRILFRRSENKMELREFGDIILSPGATAGTETAKVVVNASGNVGIGTTEPAAKLHVNGNLNIEAQVNSFDHRLLPLPGDIKRNAFFGNALAASGNQAIVGAYGEDNNTGAGYFFEKNTDGYWAQTQKLQANDKVQLQDFGISVAIDGNYAIIGAPGDSDGGTRAGAAYIYEKNASGTWVQKQKLKASNKQGHHNFGMGVVLNGDLALIGVHGADDVAPDGGVIYCFERRTDGTWIEQTTRLKSTNTRGADYFGTQISMSGARVIVGVPAVDLDSNYSVYDVGAAYIFQKNGTAWEQKLRVQPTGFGKYYFFGAAVCIDGSQAIVGAPANHTESVNKPAAYIYTCDSSGNWSATVTRKLQAEDPNASTGFGCSVAISGNLAVVGANLENAGGTKNGAVYIFEKNSDGTWPTIHTQKLWRENTDGGPYFGSTVVIAGNQLIIGVSKDNSGEFNTGAVYIYEKDVNGAWQPKKSNDLEGELNFNRMPRQLIKVPGTSFGMGIQQNTQYFRTNENFAFYKEGILQMIIKDGKVGIGTDDPGTDYLDVRGRCYSSGGWQTTNADYAEYFESENGEAIPRGTVVSITAGGKIKPAQAGETVIGVISASPSVVGNVPKEWPGKYQRDDFGEILMETYEEEGEGVTKTRTVLNPDYDESMDYTPRDQRPEWNCVGLLGQIPLLKGQPTGPNWAKIKDISDKVELWLIK